MPEPLIRLGKVRRSFGTQKERVTVLNVSRINVYPGETLGILGYAGAGKSTLMHILGLLDRADEGADDLSLSAGDTSHRRPYANVWRSPDDVNALRQTEFGFVFQAGYLLSHFSALENVALPLLLRGEPRDEAHATAARLLGRARLQRRSHGRPDELSGGEKQRVAVLRAVAHNPRIILADEPTGSLDPDTGDTLMRMLIDWLELDRANKSLCIVTHHFYQAFEYCDRFLMLRSGLISMRGRKEYLPPDHEDERIVREPADLFHALSEGGRV